MLEDSGIARKQGGDAMKKKPQRKKSLTKKAPTEERILQLLNDQAEDITSGTLREWREVARYVQNENSRLWNELGAVRPSIAALTAGLAMHHYAAKELEAWLKRQTPTSTS